MNFSCEDDFDCPDSLWCYKGSSLNNSRCDCSNLFGYMNPETDCSERSIVFYVVLIPTLFYLTLILFTFGYYAGKFFDCAKNRGFKKITPALRILGFSLLVFIFMMASFLLRLGAIANSNDWIPVEDVSLQFNGPQVDVKYSPLYEASIFFQMLYVTAGVCGIIETGLLWLEITYNANKMRNFQPFKKARQTANVLYLFFFLFAAIGLASSRNSTLSFYGYIGIPLVVLLAILVIVGRYYMLKVLYQQISSMEREHTAPHANKGESPAAKYIKVSHTVQRLSLELLVAICIMLIGCIYMFLSVANPNRQIEPGEIDYRKIGILLLDTAFIFSALSLLWYTLDAVRSMSLRQRDDSYDSKRFELEEFRSNRTTLAESTSQLEVASEPQGLASWLNRLSRSDKKNNNTQNEKS